MKTRIERIVPASLVSQVVGMSGCYNCAVSLRKTVTDYQVERTVQADFVPGSTLVVRGNAGAVHISGGDVTECRVVAAVFVPASTKSEAREIGEQVQIAAEPNEGKLVLAIRKPTMPRKHRFVSVDLDILVPRCAQVDCRTDFGRVQLAEIAGNVRAATAYGAIQCDHVHGSLDLRAQSGTGDLHLFTNLGSVVLR